MAFQTILINLKPHYQAIKKWDNLLLTDVDNTLNAHPLPLKN
jgi:hypothetical protein